MTHVMTAAGKTSRLPVVRGELFDPRETSAADEIVISHERVVLGWLLNSANTVSAREEIESIEGRQFYHPAHEHIFEAIKRHVGSPDVQLRTLEMLVGRNSPRSLGMLDQTPAIYLSDCIKDADYYDRDTFRRSVQRVKEAHTQRYGRVLIAEFAATFASGNMDAAAMAWAAAGEMLDGPRALIGAGEHRNVDLTPWLTGTHQALTPAIGGLRDDNQALLYPGLWHTLIAPTAAGKSWFALWHCVAEIRKGCTVVYAHFEEPSPKGTVARLRQIAPDLTNEQIQEHFRWLDCSARWNPGEFAKALPESMTLLILDGINAACGQHGWIVDKPESVGTYRSMFVTPGAKADAAVLSLGHPVKNTERQNERHGFGSSAWLDEVNGAGFRLVPSKKTPIGKGQMGHSTLYTVKDREGEVQIHGLLDTADKRENWYRIGSFKVDDRPEMANTAAWLNVPNEDGEDGEDDLPGRQDPIDNLADDIVGLLTTTDLGVVQGTAAIEAHLKAAGVTFSNANLSPALLRLQKDGRIVVVEGPRKRKDISLPRGEVSRTSPRGGAGRSRGGGEVGQTRTPHRGQQALGGEPNLELETRSDTMNHDSLAQETAEYIAADLVPQHGVNLTNVLVKYTGEERPPREVAEIKATLLSGYLWLSWMDERVADAMRQMHRTSA